MSEKQPFIMMFQCEECKNNFPISTEQAPNSLTHKKEFKINGQSIFLTYYDCPECSKRHFVQIDDEKSLQMLMKNKNEFIKLSVMRNKGKRISKKQSENFKKSRQNLAEYRMNLMKQFTGNVICDDETGMETELRFSV